MPIPTRLNLDILFYIMAFSDEKTLLSMMLTSQDLHHGGIKHLLRKTPSIWNKRKFRSFLSFCEARGNAGEIAYRMHYLRGLEIDLENAGSFFDSDKESPVERKLGPTSQSLAHLLTSTIRPYAHNFTRLLLLNCDDLLAANPHLSIAIASLTTLTYLNLSDATKQSFGLLRSLQSRLVEANIGLNADFADTPDGDLTEMLRHSELSMTVLTLYYTRHPTGAACYPHLHTLRICYMEDPTTRHYVTTFPNLRVLQATQCIVGFSFDPDYWLACRNLNLSQQAQSGPWRALQAYIGSILFLYIFGLRGCHVPYVHVYADDECETMEFGQLRDVVADTSPEHLVVDIKEVSDTLERAEDAMVLFEDEGFRAVKTFVLNLSLCNNDENMDMEALLECIFIGISTSALIGFELTIKWSSLKYRPGNILDVDSSGKKTRPKLSRAEKFLGGLDADSVADRLLRDSKSLRAVRVTLEAVTVERGPVDIFFDEKTLECETRHE